MRATNQALQIISIQHELSLYMGIGLQLEDMLKVFLERAQKRLSLSKIHMVWQLESTIKSPHKMISFPGKNVHLSSAIMLNIHNIFRQQLTQSEYVLEDKTHYYLCLVPDFGVLVFERLHCEIDCKVLTALTSLMSKLATSCLACVQHQTLIDEIKARREIEKKLTEQSFRDPLTQLFNRELFSVNLRSGLSNSKRSGKNGAVFYMDVDRFKVINDTLGHSCGDSVLKEIANRFRACVRQGDTLARIEGDAFALLVTDLDQDVNAATKRATRIAHKIAGVLLTPIKVGANEFTITVSMGINIFPAAVSSDDTIDTQANQIMKNADLAMYKVKNDTRNCYMFFNPALQSYSDNRAKIEQQLSIAIQNNEFEVYCQPLLNKAEEIVGAEALIRWNSPELGWISPIDFISIAEDCGLIVPIGDWVIEQACTVLKQVDLTNSNNTLKYISVNISPKQFAQSTFVSSLLAILHKHKLPPSKLRLEITENVAIDNIESTIAKMQTLKDKGVSIMLDDFGTGYSSLSYLHKFPLKTIKIDRSFVTDIDTSKDNQVITCSIIDICEHFSMECIVEGVENKDELAFLMQRNITAFQGYHFYRPLPQNEFIKLFATIEENDAHFNLDV